jgi:L-fuconolactonase
MHTSRRQFMAAVGAAALGAATGSAQPQAGPIVDPHLHLWDLSRFRLPWIERDSPLNRSFVVRDYLGATEGLNVVKAVYMEVDVAPDQQVAEAEYVLDICRQGNTPMVGAVISGRPASEEFGRYLDRFKDNRYLKGVRQVLHVPSTPAGYSAAPSFVRGIRWLGERGLSFDLCMRPTDLGDAVRLVESCPDTRFILDHCGNGPVYAEDRSQWRRDIERLAAKRNVVCKISGIVVQAREGWRAEDLAPVINPCLDAFGPDRVMFAGDWPVCTLKATFRQWVDALRAIVRERPMEQQRRLFHDNAVRFYAL